MVAQEEHLSTAVYCAARAAISPLINIRTGACIGSAVRVDEDGVLCLPPHAVEHGGKIDLQAVQMQAFGQSPLFIASNPALGMVLAHCPPRPHLQRGKFAELQEGCRIWVVGSQVGRRVEPAPLSGCELPPAVGDIVEIVSSMTCAVARFSDDAPRGGGAAVVYGFGDLAGIYWDEYFEDADSDGASNISNATDWAPDTLELDPDSVWCGTRPSAERGPCMRQDEPPIKPRRAGTTALGLFVPAMNIIDMLSQCAGYDDRLTGWQVVRPRFWR